MTREHALAYLQARGLESTSDTLISAVTSAGGSDAVIAYLRKTDAPKNEPTSPAFAALNKAARAIERNDLEAAYKHIHDASNADSKNAELHFAAAGILRKAEIWEESAKEYRIVIQLVPDLVDGWQGLSYVYYRGGNEPQAAEYARTAIKVDPNDSDSHKFLGLALSGMDDDDGALREYSEALRLDPKNAAVYYDRGNLEEEAKKYDEAITDYKKSIEFDANDYTHWYNLGIAYAHKDDFTNAIAAYRRAKLLNPNFLDVRQNLGATYCEQQRHAEAISEFRDLLKIDPTWNMARPCLAKSLAAINDLKGAVEVGEQFLRYEPQDEHMLRWMCQWYWALGRLSDSEPLYDRLIAIAQQQYGDDSKEYGLALTQRALLFAAEKKYPQADSDYKNGLRLMRAAGSEYQPVTDAVQKKYDEMLALWHGMPVNANTPAASDRGKSGPATPVAGDPALLNWQSQLQAATSAMNQRKYSEAASLFEKAVEAAGKIEQTGDQTAQTLQLYSGLYVRQKDFSKAEELMLRALASSRKNMGVGSQFEARSLDSLGDLYLVESKYDDAIQTFTAALDLQKKWLGPRDPGLGLAMDHLASAYSGAGKFDQARPLLDQYLKITEEFYGADAPNVSVPLDHLGALYVRAKEYDKAEVVYRRNLGLYEKRFGQDSPMLNGTLYLLADCLRQLGRPEEAKAFDERRDALLKH